MAKLSHEDVLNLAQLARLHLTAEEVDKFQKEIEAILGYVEQLQSIDLHDLEPTSQVTGLKNVMRSDEERDYGATPKELLKNTPATEKDQIKVRRILA